MVQQQRPGHVRPDGAATSSSRSAVTSARTRGSPRRRRAARSPAPDRCRFRPPAADGPRPGWPVACCREHLRGLAGARAAVASVSPPYVTSRNRSWLKPTVPAGSRRTRPDDMVRSSSSSRSSARDQTTCWRGLDADISPPHRQGGQHIPGGLVHLAEMGLDRPHPGRSPASRVRIWPRWCPVRRPSGRPRSGTSAAVRSTNSGCPRPVRGCGGAPGPATGRSGRIPAVRPSSAPSAAAAAGPVLAL